MQRFDYKKAHKEWALPEWQKLDENFKRLYRMCNEHCADQYQNKDLGMDWPFAEFREAFDAEAKHRPKELAHSGYVIHGLGHWDYEGAGEWPRSNHGAYWKYELFVEQALAERGHCYESFKPYDTQKGWMMAHEEGTKYSNEELAQMFKPLVKEHFNVFDVRNVNYRVKGYSGPGHPFIIGDAHLENSSGIYLDPRCAPCAECKLPFDNHESDRVLILQRKGKDLPESKLTEDEQQTLVSIQETLEEHKLDGIAFVK